MPTDNTLGAPTEGLGQTVTFAAGGVAVPQQQPVQRQMLRNAASGGAAMRTAQALQVPPAQPDATFAVLAKLGGDLLKPHLEAERTAAYVQGMQKAAQGQAIAEIVDEQPWYSKLFGSTSLVDGARAFTANAKASAVAVDFETNMKTYRQVSPSEFAKVTTEKLVAAQTGDGVTDMMLTQQLGQVLPQVMKHQVKEHLRYQQEQYTTGLSSALDARLSLVGAASAAERDPASTASLPDTLEIAAEATKLFEKPADLDQRVHDQLVGDSVIKALAAKNFAAYSLLESSGKLAQLTPEVEYRVQRAKDQASARARANASMGILQQEAEWAASREGKTEEDVIAEAAALNARYTQETGDPSPYIPKAATVRELVQLKEQRFREAEALRKAALVARNADEKARLGAQARTAYVAQLGTADSVYLGSLKKPERDAVFAEFASVAPDKLPFVLAKQHAWGQVWDLEKDAIQGSFGQAIMAKSSTMFAAAYNKYAQLVTANGGRADVADTYAGQFNKEAAIYHRIAAGRQLSALEADAAFLAAINPPPPLPHGKVADSLVKAATDGTTTAAVNAIGRVFGGDSFPLKDPRGLVAAVMPYVNERLDPESALEAARKNHPTLTELGGYHWVRPAGTTGFKEWVLSNHYADNGIGGADSSNWNQTFLDTIETFSKRAGIEKAMTLNQMTDAPGGVPMMYIVGNGSDDKPKMTFFTAEDMHKVRVEKKRSAPAKQETEIMQTANPAWGMP